MKKPTASVLPFVSIAFVLFSQVPLQGALLFYDGFAAGGTTPGAGQYNTSPSTTGLDNDSLIRSTSGDPDGQAPATAGFGSGGWRSTEPVAPRVYGRANASGLSYTGMPTVAGSASIFRNGSNSGTQAKNYTRSFTAGGLGASEGTFSAR